MISSEVQRTLVKSPPELWNELSDPESLGRHLGELGEIEITRVEPENLVEWEAEGTTGTVEIKPSGWGTRVTLTVVREVAAAETAPAAADEVASGASPVEAVSEAPAAEAEAPAEPEAPAASEDEPEAEVQAETSQAVLDAEAPTAAEPEADDEPEAEAEAAAEVVAQPWPAPATEAARRAAGWPSDLRETDEEPASDEAVAEISDRSGEPDGLHAWATQAALQPTEQEKTQRTPEPSELAEPRRGFFARLFGRRRKEAVPVEAAPAHAPDQSGEAEEPEQLLEPLAEEPQDPAPELDDALAVAADDPEPAEVAPILLDPAGDPDVDTAESDDPADEEEPEPVAEEGDSQATEAVAASLAGQPVAAETEHELAPTGAADEMAAAPDLSAELKAAEEVAAEQVTAVLTAVLDRLGAAHHRPFSRP
jgi:hypothetical protein